MTEEKGALKDVEVRGRGGGRVLNTKRKVERNCCGGLSQTNIRAKVEMTTSDPIKRNIRMKGTNRETWRRSKD